MKTFALFTTLTVIILNFSGCFIQPSAPTTDTDQGLTVAIPVTVVETPFSPDVPCEGRFVAHDLDHITTIAGEVVQLFDSNGAGLGINDLDNDGDLDIVLANLAGPNAIFWNESPPPAEGGFSFRKQEFSHGQTRGVNIVDVDGDGWQDIVFAHRRLRPYVWMNRGQTHFSLLDQFDVEQVAYTMAWADLDGDTDLDVVAATYQTEHQREDAADWGQGGVIYYEHRGDRFIPTDLSLKSQALALLLVDLNEDGRLDIWVGHDFLLEDQVWLASSEGWKEAQPFEVMSQNTMSFAPGDIDNDGRLEVLAADMKPFKHDADTLAAWGPLMEAMHSMDMATDRQIMENVLQIPAADGKFTNRALDRGLSATGWSWSTRFGDLDNDGFLDFYGVNGMAAKEMFSHLPNNELVEENLAFRNAGDGTFKPAPEWNLNATAGGRSMSMADLDRDGDLDIVVNNLLARAQIFENRLCAGASLEVDLFWPQRMNTRAIGAKLRLYTDEGMYTREVRSASGYLSGDPARLHFGFPADSQLQKLEILWPDGQISVIDDLTANTLLTIERRD